MEQHYVTVTLCIHSGQVVQAAGPDHDDERCKFQLFASPCRISSLNMCRGKILSGKRLVGKTSSSHAWRSMR